MSLSSHSPTPRSAFTLIEMLAVVTVIGILVSLLLPAVQAAREAARRTQCSNHLTQHIMAVHNYETLHRVFPPGTVDSKGPILSQPLGYHHNWISQLLPFFHHEAAYHHIDRQVGVYHKTNAPVRRLTISLFHCPSTFFSPGGYTAYAGVHHSQEASIDADNNGVFFLNSRLGGSDVTDGLSNTLFIGEKLSEPNDLGWMSGTRATLRNTGEPFNEARNLFAGRWASLPPLPPGLNQTDRDPDSAGSTGEVGQQDPLGVRGDEDAALSARRAVGFVGGFNSFHKHAANFAFGDGSVRVLADGISQKVRQQLGNRSDGQLLDFDR